MLDSDCTGDAGWAPSLLSPSSRHPSLYVIVVQNNWGLLGWQGSGTHTAFLLLMTDTHQEGACFWARCYLPTPAHSHDTTASSVCKFRLPDSPLNLPSCKTLLCCQARPHSNWGHLWGHTRVAAMNNSDSMGMFGYVPPQTKPLPVASGPKLLSASWIF